MMLEHLNPESSPPPRTVLVCAAGFVGGAIHECLSRETAPLLALTPEHVDLLAEGATEALARKLQENDALVLVSALAPCKDNSSLLKNLRMVEAVCAATQNTTLSHLVYFSSDAV